METIKVKDCHDCPFMYQDYVYCHFQYIDTWDVNEIFKKCPLKQKSIKVELVK